ncbi:MAG: GNAT family N-acetyltransferase [Pleomorphochaeta sp.]
MSIEKDIISFRFATKDDLKLVISFVKKLAIHVDMVDEVKIEEEVFSKWMFDEKSAHVLFLLKDGKEIGIALYLYLFSTFNCRPTLYLEDLYIDKEHRNNGYGKLIFKQLAKIAKERDLNRIEWTCLDNNDKGLIFYNSLGAEKLGDRRLLRLENDNLDKFIAL